MEAGTEVMGVEAMEATEVEATEVAMEVEGMEVAMEVEGMEVARFSFLVSSLSIKCSRPVRCWDSTRRRPWPVSQQSARGRCCQVAPCALSQPETTKG